MKLVKLFTVPSICSSVVFLFSWLGGAKFFDDSMLATSVIAGMVFFATLGWVVIHYDSEGQL